LKTGQKLIFLQCCSRIFHTNTFFPYKSLRKLPQDARRSFNSHIQENQSKLVPECLLDFIGVKEVVVTTGAISRAKLESKLESRRKIFIAFSECRTPSHESFSVLRRLSSATLPCGVEWYCDNMIDMIDWLECVVSPALATCSVPYTV